tara:strand:+ start:788 stop:1687 length:900 start_codon:yes stop_codon:yes gene_type:complete
MSSFNLTRDKKYEGARNDINDRMQGFMTSNYHNPQQQQKVYKNDNLLGNQNPNLVNDKRNFKDDINHRINSFNTMVDIGQKSLPLHNNIRDYNITVGSKKDEFNNRLSNYNYLSSNIKPNIFQSQDICSSKFHSNFKEDNNKRLEQLSPLSRNLGIPFNGTEMPAKPDFGSNIQNNDIDNKFTNYNYHEQFQKPEDDIKNQSVYIKNYKTLSENKIPEVNYNSYDKNSFGTFIKDEKSLNRNEENMKRLEHQKDIKNFDYSLMDNNQFKYDDINNVPELAVYSSMPVDTRQEFHFQQNI